MFFALYSHVKSEDAVITRVQRISTVSSPSIDRTGSTVLLTSAEDHDDNVNYELAVAGDSISNTTQNGNRFSAHSKSSSKRSTDEVKSDFSGRSNSPSQKSLNDTVLDTSSQLTILAVDDKMMNATSVSRPISVSSVATTKSLYDEYEDRPATSLAKSNASSASAGNRDNKSRTSMLADENDRPISVTSRTMSQAGDIKKETEPVSDDRKSMEQENDRILKSENEVLEKSNVVEHPENAGTYNEPNESVIETETQGNIEEVTANAPLPVSSDNESNFTADATDEVDFVKERSDEQTTTTSTVSSVQNFSARPSMRFRKRKVSPTKPPTQIVSRQRIKDQHASCLQQLDSSNWDQIMLGLQSFVCLMRNNPEQIEPQLHQYCLALSKNIKNLRSQVSRASCQAAGEFFESHSKLLEQEADDLALALLNRTADTNKFLRSDATKALKIMCETLPVPKVSIISRKF